MEFNLNLNKSISSKILVSENARKEIVKILSSSSYFNLAVLADESVYDLWISSERNDFLEIKSNVHVFIPGKGEDIKSIEKYERVSSALLKAGIERDSLILAIGGGALTDFAGFIASTYMRGIDLVTVPTTLLAQVDAAIGGKNGINLIIKNAIGTFYLPNYVIIDPIFIETLPFEEYLNGLAEIIKYYVIKGGIFKNIFENNLYLVKERDKNILLKLIEESVETKLQVVKKDFEEKNERMILNFGHTIGHAIESLSEYKIKHGTAISYGFIVESIIANSVLGFPFEDINFILDLINNLGFRFNFRFNEDDIIRTLILDKKRRKGKIMMALPSKIGNFEILEVSKESIKEAVVKANLLIQKC